MMWFYRRRKSSAVVLLHPFILYRYICLGVFYTYILLFVHDIESFYIYIYIYIYMYIYI